MRAMVKVPHAKFVYRRFHTASVQSGDLNSLASTRDQIHQRLEACLLLRHA